VSAEFAVLYSDSSDVYRNLAMEELLLTGAAREMPIVMFYTNDNAVVIGKHQNPWMECAPEVLENGMLARRISGGGAVYHDCGNLNYSLMFRKKNYSRTDAHGVLLDALAGFGLRATVRGGTSIVVMGRKISGNAFCHKRETVLHHGTLLIDVDLDHMRIALNAPALGIETNATKSVPAGVVNLRELKPEIDSRQMADAVVDAFATKYNRSPRICEISRFIDAAKLDALRRKHASFDWIYGSTPKFRVMRSVKIKNGEQSVSLTMEKGCVSAVGEGVLTAELMEKLVGQSFFAAESFCKMENNAL